MFKICFIVSEIHCILNEIYCKHINIKIIHHVNNKLEFFHQYQHKLKKAEIRVKLNF